MKRFVVSCTALLFLSVHSAWAGDAFSGINLGHTEVSGEVGAGNVDVDGEGSRVRFSGLFAGPGTRIGSAKITRQLHTDLITVHNGGQVDYGVILTGYGTDVDQLEVNSSAIVGELTADNGDISVAVLDLLGIRADRLVYNESINAKSLTATNGGSIILGGIHPF